MPPELVIKIVPHNLVVERRAGRCGTRTRRLDPCLAPARGHRELVWERDPLPNAVLVTNQSWRSVPYVRPTV